MRRRYPLQTSTPNSLQISAGVIVIACFCFCFFVLFCFFFLFFFLLFSNIALVGEGGRPFGEIVFEDFQTNCGLVSSRLSDSGKRGEENCDA